MGAFCINFKFYRMGNTSRFTYSIRKYNYCFNELKCIYITYFLYRTNMVLFVYRDTIYRVYYLSISERALEIGKDELNQDIEVEEEDFEFRD